MWIFLCAKFYLKIKNKYKIHRIYEEDSFMTGETLELFVEKNLSRFCYRLYLNLCHLKHFKGRFLSLVNNINQFVPNAPFLYLLKTSQNRKGNRTFSGGRAILTHFTSMFHLYTSWFSDVFRRYRSGTLAWNRLSIIFLSTLQKNIFDYMTLIHFIFFS